MTTWEVTRAPGVGSSKGLQLITVITPREQGVVGSALIVDFSLGGKTSFVFGLQSLIDKEVALLRKQLGY
jgi:hypothetical protein